MFQFGYIEKVLCSRQLTVPLSEQLISIFLCTSLACVISDDAYAQRWILALQEAILSSSRDAENEYAKHTCHEVADGLDAVALPDNGHDTIAEIVQADTEEDISEDSEQSEAYKQQQEQHEKNEETVLAMDSAEMEALEIMRLELGRMEQQKQEGPVNEVDDTNWENEQLSDGELLKFLRARRYT